MQNQILRNRGLSDIAVKGGVQVHQLPQHLRRQWLILK